MKIIFYSLLNFWQENLRLKRYTMERFPRYILYNYLHDELVLHVPGPLGLIFCEGVLFWEEVALKWIIHFYNEIRSITSSYDNWQLDLRKHVFINLGDYTVRGEWLTCADFQNKTLKMSTISSLNCSVLYLVFLLQVSYFPLIHTVNVSFSLFICNCVYYLSY